MKNSKKYTCSLHAQLLGNNKEVEFSLNLGNYFFSARNLASRIESVHVFGTFTAWAILPEWQLQRDSSNPLRYTIKKNIKQINIPGNSGLPEFKIRITFRKKFSNAIQTIEIGSREYYARAFNSNFVLCLTLEDSCFLKKQLEENRALILKSPSDFNLNTKKGIEEISNFRGVPGTTKLFRGYHPYKLSHPDYPTERIRVSLVKHQLEENQIQSIITLSGEEEEKEGVEEVSLWHEKIRQNGNQLFVNTDYSIVYYNSNGSEFTSLICTIVRFINSHPGPYYIHCRLGTDRTGTTSAVLAALCGASWEDICRDYENTNRMGIYEFRSSRLLEYCFTTMLGHSPVQSQNLQKDMAAHFASCLSQEELWQLKKNLCQ